jgi:glycosyltransferase involved in cell wall biosynthesis
MKILFLPNWKVQALSEDVTAWQAPDKQVTGQPYWFFRYFPADCQVDIVDFQQPNWLSFLEKKLNLYVWQGIKAFFRRGHYDLVVSHGAQSGLIYSLLRAITFRRRPPHLIFDIGSMNGARSNKIENAVISLALKGQPHIVVHSRVIIDNYRQTYPALVERTKYIPFGVDVDDFTPAATEEVGNYVLAFGAAKRDYPTLLEAWAGIRTDTKLCLIGYRQSVELDNVETIARVSISELKEYIRQALFVVIPLPVFNYSYGQMSFLQSMSMGKTVVVTRTPSSVDYLQDGEGAYFVEPGDVAGMRDRISTLLNDEAMLAAANAKARAFVEAHFSEQMMAEQLHDYMQSLTGSGK